MIKESISYTHSRVVIYFNSDILFHKDINIIVNILINEKSLYTKQLLIVGKRCDIFWKDTNDEKNHDMIWKKCILHSASGIDYFIFTSYTFISPQNKIMEEIVVGRVRYDNIILATTIKRNSNLVIDSTNLVKAIHLSVTKMEKNNQTIV